MIDIIATRNLYTGDVIIHHTFNWDEFPDQGIMHDMQIKMCEEIDKNFPNPPYETDILTGMSLEAIYDAYPLFAPKN
ncbi:MAG: hypothetical protein LWY06_16590 [Firmicutes bacterium]|nr:hypothetical protein [Bacillota bacterium]